MPPPVHPTGMPAVSSAVGLVAGVPQTVAALALGAVGLTTLSAVLILGACCRKKNKSAPEVKTKSKTLPRDAEALQETSLQERFASGLPFEDAARKNPLFRKESNASNASDFSGFGKDRKDSIESDYSGFGKSISTSGLAKEDKKNGYIGIVEEGSAKPKKERDLAGAKARKDAERAAKIAKMKALRAAKKMDESKALEEALAVIDNLEE